jgi:hypothetical protein
LTGKKFVVSLLRTSLGKDGFFYSRIPIFVALFPSFAFIFICYYLVTYFVSYRHHQSVALRLLSIFRIIRPANGGSVFMDENHFEHCKSQWNSLMEIMATVGFSFEVSGRSEVSSETDGSTA